MAAVGFGCPAVELGGKKRCFPARLWCGFCAGGARGGTKGVMGGAVGMPGGVRGRTAALGLPLDVVRGRGGVPGGTAWW